MSDLEIFSGLTGLLGEGRGGALCTIIEKRGSGPRDLGAKMLVDPDGRTTGTLGGGGMERIVVRKALKALMDGRPTTITFALGVEPRGGAIAVDSKCGGEVRVFIDIVKPEPRLVLVGSGHIAKPLAELAHMVGFETIVVDDAPTATKKRFPTASAILSGPFEDELDGLEVRPSDFVAVVHGETPHELAALRKMLRLKPLYIGLLGSRNKAEGHRNRLLAEGFSREEVDAIHAPIGLDIGAETPEEIALSIVAELIRERRRG
ncbi:MAG: XdhC family protein [Candidatus Bathyarchaeia archaeon]